MTNKLKWRLGKLPTPQEVTTLVNDKIITKEEAREILFNLETEEEKSMISLAVEEVENLKSEIKFLRELVEKLSNGSNYRITEVIREVAPRYTLRPWNQPYITWCTATDNNITAATTASAVYNVTSGSGGSLTVGNNSFADIETF